MSGGEYLVPSRRRQKTSEAEGRWGGGAQGGGKEMGDPRQGTPSPDHPMAAHGQTVQPAKRDTRDRLL